MSRIYGTRKFPARHAKADISVMFGQDRGAYIVDWPKAMTMAGVIALTLLLWASIIAGGYYIIV